MVRGVRWPAIVVIVIAIAAILTGRVVMHSVPIAVVGYILLAIALVLALVLRQPNRS